MKQTLKLLLNLSLLAFTLPAFGMIPNNDDMTWQQRLYQVIESRNGKAAGLALGATAIGGVAYKYRKQIAQGAKKVKNIATAYVSEPTAETLQDVKEKARARYAKEKQASITRGTVLRTVLAGVGLAALVYGTEAVRDRQVNWNNIQFKEAPGILWSELKKKYNEGVNTFSSLTNTQKVGTGVAAAALTGFAGWLGYKGYKAYKTSTNETVVLLESLKSSLTKLKKVELREAGVAIDELFIEAQEQPIVLFTTREFYNNLEETQKILVGQIIQQHSSENLLNND